jgi:hypothetical protein
MSWILRLGVYVLAIVRVLFQRFGVRFNPSIAQGKVFSRAVSVHIHYIRFPL